MALSNDKTRPVKAGYDTAKVSLANDAGTVYKGALLIVDVSDADGYARPAAGTGATGDMFAGVALEQVAPNASGSDGDSEILVISSGRVGFPIASFTVANIGATVYASDDDTLTATSTNNNQVGRIVEVTSSEVYVEVGDLYMLPQA